MGLWRRNRRILNMHSPCIHTMGDLITLLLQNLKHKWNVKAANHFKNIRAEVRHL
nr:MAG TPA: hypothetical protein [Caudoviricetes sp.]